MTNAPKEEKQFLHPTANSTPLPMQQSKQPAHQQGKPSTGPIQSGTLDSALETVNHHQGTKISDGLISRSDGVAEATWQGLSELAVEQEQGAKAMRDVDEIGGGYDAAGAMSPGTAHPQAGRKAGFLG